MQCYLGDGRLLFFDQLVFILMTSLYKSFLTNTAGDCNLKTLLNLMKATTRYRHRSRSGYVID